MKQIIMTSPLQFDVQYQINPWMNGNIGQVRRLRAIQQWTEVHETISRYADVMVTSAVPDDCVDAVFTANAGLIYDGQFIPSQFRNPERMCEEPYWTKVFQDKYALSPISQSRYTFEGAGDALFSSDRKHLWVGCGPRTSMTVVRDLFIKFDAYEEVMVRPLELVNPLFYHLDTCFCPLDNGYLLWYPPAFSEHSQMVIRSWYSGKSIEVSDDDAILFACNSVSIGDNLFTSFMSGELAGLLNSIGIYVHYCDVSEFLKSGGGVKCLTLEVIARP